MRAQIRSGISGLTGSRPATAVPVLGDDTRRILGVKEDSDDDSAIEDPNTESLKSRPRSVQVAPPGSEILQPQVFPVIVSRGPRLSPPTKMRSGKAQAESSVPGISQLRASKSPVRNLFPDSGTARAQSRSSTLVDAESLAESSQRDPSKSGVIPSSEVFVYSPLVDPSFRPLPLDLSETASQLEDSPQSQSQSLQDKVSDFLARLHQDSINLSLDIPKPRPFPGKYPVGDDNDDGVPHDGDLSQEEVSTSASVTLTLM